jgi:hypothetical protein
LAFFATSRAAGPTVPVEVRRGFDAGRICRAADSAAPTGGCGLEIKSKFLERRVPDRIAATVRGLSMSVNAVSGASLRHDLVSALRQARAAGIQPIDASGYSTASQDTGSAQGTGSGTTAPTSSAATSPVLSSDLMASLLQLQSDFSQMGLQAGVTSGSDTSTSTSGATDTTEAAASSAPVHHHHGHHARPPEPDAAEQSGSSTTATDAPADTTAAAAGSSTGSDTGDGLQSLLQHVTKAIAAYAMGGPVGIAAAAVTSAKA